MANGGDPNDSKKVVRKRKMLALLNPFGGGGRAVAKWNQVKPIFSLAHIEVILRHTERRNHAFDIVKNELETGDYDGIISISGDG